MTPAQLTAAAVWWHTGNIRKAAAFLGLAEQTVKNQLLWARRGSQVHTTLDLVKVNWRDVAKELDRLGLESDGLRKLRYRFDGEYRERVKNQSREAMRRLRTKRVA